MDHYQTTFETWDKLAELYFEKFSAIRIYDATYNSFCSLISKPNPEILEIGCGPGNVTRYLMDHRPDLKITGLDVAANMIAYARKMVPEAEFAVMDIRNLHEIKKNFDAILNGFCLPYQSKEDLDKFLEDCYAVLNTEGIIYLSCIEGEYSKSGMETGSKPEYRMQVFYYSQQYLQQVLTKYGFSILSMHLIPYPSEAEKQQVHIVLIGKKEKGF